jgi:hypothetical protein
LVVDEDKDAGFDVKEDDRKMSPNDSPSCKGNANTGLKAKWNPNTGLKVKLNLETKAKHLRKRKPFMMPKRKLLRINTFLGTGMSRAVLLQSRGFDECGYSPLLLVLHPQDFASS